MSDGMGREFTYLSSHATNRYFIPNWGLTLYVTGKMKYSTILSTVQQMHLPSHSTQR